MVCYGVSLSTEKKVEHLGLGGLYPLLERAVINRGGAYVGQISENPLEMF